MVTRYSAPKGDPRHKMVRKATCILHKVFNCSDYTFLKDNDFHAAMQLTLIAMAVGCLKNLTKDPEGLHSEYSWIANCTGQQPNTIITRVCENLALPTGLPVRFLLLVASHIWGGGVMNDEPMKESSRIMGVVCSQVTIVFDILVNTQAIAQFGLSKGLFTLYQGSVPMLPRDPATGYITAGVPRPWRARQRASEQNSALPPNIDGPLDLLLSLEPHIDQTGALTALLCAWRCGGVVFELDAHTVFCNLLHRRGLTRSDSCAAETRSRKDNHDTNRLSSRYVPESSSSRSQPPKAISRYELLRRGPLAYSDSSRVTIAAGPQLEWQVVAAGCVKNGGTTLVQNPEDAHRLFSRGWDETLFQLDFTGGQETIFILGYEGESPLAEVECD